MENAHHHNGAPVTVRETNRLIMIQNREPLADSRVIAAGLDIEHHNFLATLDKYKNKIESKLGLVLFETEQIHGAVRGRPVRYALLTKRQFNFVGTLSRNTDAVVDFKLALVEAFEAAEKALENGSQADGERRAFEIIRRNHPSFALPAVSDEQYLELLEVHQEAISRLVSAHKERLQRKSAGGM